MAGDQSGSRFLRRSLLTGRVPVQRPPWTDEARVRAHCTSCGKCVSACPEGILVNGPAGTPAVDFNRGACTFCEACAGACDDHVFRDTAETPWSLTADVGQQCLLSAGIACRTCTDACDEGALRFDLCGGGVGTVVMSPDLCTGCGGCLGVCPVDAISLKPSAAAAA